MNIVEKALRAKVAETKESYSDYSRWAEKHKKKYEEAKKVLEKYLKNG